VKEFTKLPTAPENSRGEPSAALSGWKGESSFARVRTESSVAERFGFVLFARIIMGRNDSPTAASCNVSISCCL
jgi:hypothetical protein